jgi:hypothetical protein
LYVVDANSDTQEVADKIVVAVLVVEYVGRDMMFHLSWPPCPDQSIVVVDPASSRR